MKVTGTHSALTNSALHREERCADILESMSGTRPSDGWVHALLARAAAAVAAANTAIRALVILARVICGDETPLRAGPGPRRNKKYLQVACTNLLTYYLLGERTLPSFKDFIYSDLHGTVIVHDRYVNYDHFDGVSHQLCTSHLLRDVEDAAQVYPHAHWPAQIARELRALIHAANTARGQGLDQVPDDMTAEHLTLFRNAVNAGLSQVSRVPGAKAKQRPGRLLLECLKNREADVLRFLTDTAIPPTSNQAERDLRPAKTQQKISGRLRSEKTTRDRYAIRGYASTAAKHGVAVFTAIYAALAGNPGIPPLGLTLIASVRRRRRELAPLKTVGFTQRQLAATVAWQSSVSAIAGVIVALPLGIGIRRWLWTLFA
jgi:transposase